MANVLLFGPLSDVLGVESVKVELTGEVKTVADLLIQLQQQGPGWQKYLQTDKLQITVNRQFVEASQIIANTDEIALIPLPGTI